MVLSYDTRIPVVELGPAIEWCEGDVISFDATQAFGVTYAWSTGASTPSIQVNSPGLYTIDITAPCATATDDVEIIPGSDCDVHEGIYVPNVFSPNGDGINDVFTISFGSDLTVSAVSGTIYDRWGNLVFASDQQPFEWNGFFGDEKMQPGVYAYLIHVTYTNGVLETSELLYGDVTLIR
jgi:gliding motility-associated-like protein